MRKYISKGMLSLAFMALAFTGCSDYLTTEDAQKVSETQITSTVAGLSSVLTSAYNRLIFGDYCAGAQPAAASFGYLGFPMRWDVQGPDIESTTNYGGAPSMVYQFTNDFTSATSAYPNNFWASMYRTINIANIVIGKADDATGDATQRTQIVAQAKAIRAIAYFQLLMSFQQTYQIAKSKRGVILRLSPDEETSKGFSTVEECYQQVVSDLNDAITGLSGFKRSEKWEINADVARGILARVYQVMGNWSGAEQMASAVYANYNHLMSKEQWYSGFDHLMEEGCDELVWGAKMTNTNNVSSSIEFDFWYNQDPGYGEGMTDGPVYSFIQMFVDQKYVDLFDEDDYRGTRCDKTTGVTDADEQAVMFWHRTNNGDSELRARWAYNKMKTYGNGEYNLNTKLNSVYNISFPFMRGSEMLLIMAEAEAEQGKTAEALAHLNTLRTARNAHTTTTTDKAALLEEIYVERRKELLGEGLTGSYDLLRLQRPLIRYAADANHPSAHFSWGISNLARSTAADGQPIGRLESNDYLFLMQIPSSEISNNDAISEADQNPYSGTN